MKLKLIAIVAAFAASAGFGFAAPNTGFYGFGIELDGTGPLATNSGTTTLYELVANPDALPAGSLATPSTAWGSTTYNLGTYVYGQNTLTLTGGSFATWKNEGADVSSATLEISLNGNPGPYTAVNLPFGANLTLNGDSSGHNQIWDTESLSTNLLAGLNPGTYTIDVYGVINTTDGLQYANNSGSNFSATFTVVPEPSTYAMMAGGLVALVVFQRLRRKSVV